MARLVRCIVCVCVLLTLTLSGCATWARWQRATVGLNYPHATGEMLTQRGQDHYQAVSRIAAHDARALVEDVDLLFLTERTTRLTRWHDR